MKKLLVASIAAAAFCGAPAFAADMPVKAPINPIFNWTGWYIGGHAGAGWAKSQERDNPPFINGLIIFPGCGLASPGGDCAHILDGFIGGGQIGYNWQRGNWVFGLESSFSGSDISGSTTHLGANTYATKIRSLLLATGRLGYAWDRMLLYGKAGYAGGSVRFMETNTIGGDTAITSAWHNGWAVGVGMEYAWTQNWILGVEYNFADLGNKGHHAVGSPSGIATIINVDADQFQSVLARLSYKFGSR